MDGTLANVFSYFPPQVELLSIMSANTPCWCFDCICLKGVLNIKYKKRWSALLFKFHLSDFGLAELCIDKFNWIGYCIFLYNHNYTVYSMCWETQIQLGHVKQNFPQKWTANTVQCHHQCSSIKNTMKRHHWKKEGWMKVKAALQNHPFPRRRACWSALHFSMINAPRATCRI